MKTAALIQWFESLAVDQAEKIKIDFAVSIDKAIKDLGLTRKEVAVKLATSPAWVTKVLRGDVNLTIESMAKLCDAVGYELEFKICDRNVVRRETLVTHSEFVSRGFARAKYKGAYEIDLGPARAAEYCNDREYADAA